MSLINSLYILDNHGNPLVLKNYKKESDAALIKQFYSEFSKHKSEAEVSYPIITIRDTYFAYLNVADCMVVSTFQNDVQVLLVIKFMQMIIHVLKSIMGEDLEFMSEGVRNNMGKLAIVFDHFMDYGYPLLTQTFPMENTFRQDSFVQKVENALTAPLRDREVSNAIDKFIESMGDIRQENWTVARPSVDEEILFDVLEYIDCIIDKNGHMISYDVHGEVKVTSMVSEPVDLNVFFSVPNQLTDFSIHECLYDTFDSFDREKLLNFKIPQGNFVLMNYKYFHSDMRIFISQWNRPEVMNPRIPLDIISSIKPHGNDEMKIDIKIQGSMIRGAFFRIFDINAKLFFPSDLKIKEATSKGILKTNEKDGTILWKIGEFDKIQDMTATFIFALNGKSIEELSKIVLGLKFQIDSYTFSGNKIEKATFKDPNVKYTKKARYISKSGFYEIRLN